MLYVAVQAAAQSYFRALEIQPDYVEAMINLASVHHRHGSLDMARRYYEMALGVARAAVDDRIMLHTNLGVTYVMDYDGGDFYGERLAVLVVGFLRPEMKFDGLDALLNRIQTDIGMARSQLDGDRWKSLQADW